MTNNEINKLIAKYRKIITQNEKNIKDCKQQISDLQGLRNKAVAARNDIENSKARRQSALDRQFPTGSNINFEYSYKAFMQGIVSGSEYTSMINELKQFESRITGKINRLSKTKTTCDITIRQSKQKIKYLESQKEK